MKLDIFKLGFWVLSFVWAGFGGFTNCHRISHEERCYDGFTCQTWFGYSASVAAYWYPDLCQCCEGYKMEDYRCVDINECEKNICDQLCVNSLGSYKCLCNKGYTYNKHQGRCVFAGPCFQESNLCEQICQPLGIHKYRCKCYYGFVLASDKVTCTAISSDETES